MALTKNKNKMNKKKSMMSDIYYVYLYNYE